jgi:hypothetical protein
LGWFCPAETGRSGPWDPSPSDQSWRRYSTSLVVALLVYWFAKKVLKEEMVAKK